MKIWFLIPLIVIGCSSDPSWRYEHVDPPEEIVTPPLRIPRIPRTVMLKKCNVYEDYSLKSLTLASIKKGEHYDTQEIGSKQFYKVFIAEGTSDGYVLKACFKKAPPKKRPSRAPRNKVVT